MNGGRGAHGLGRRLLMPALPRTRCDRLLRLVLQLRAEGRLTGKQLSERLDANLRTVMRDMAPLQELGLPLSPALGRRGGYRLLADDALTPLALCGQETMFRAVLAWALYASAEPAGEAFFDCLSPEEQLTIRLIRSRVYSPAAELNASFAPAKLPSQIVHALLRNQVLQLRLQLDCPAAAPGAKRQTRGPSQRQSQRWITFHPFGAVLSRQRWYLVGQSGLAIRKVRVDQIGEFRATADRFRVPADFSLRDWWAANQDGRPKARVLLRIASAQVEELLGWLDGPEARVLPGRETLVSLYAQDWQSLVPFILSCGGDVIVEEPAELRAAVLQNASAMVRNYSVKVAQFASPRLPEKRASA